MARQLPAVLLLSLLGASGADRALLAHKPNSGTNIHAVAVSPYNYYSSTGNGTWTTALSSVTNGYYFAANPAYNATAATNWGAVSSTAYAYLTNGGVGPFTAAGPYGSINELVFPSRSTGIAVSTGYAGSATPAILTTKDQALTWQAVTGFGANPFNAATGSPAGNVPAGTVMAGPDLTSVACVGKICWAVGGYINGSPSLAEQPAFGVVLVSSNIGTFWNYVRLPAPTVVSGSKPLAVGCLMSVAADSAGKHVYAVGAPASSLATTQVATTVSSFAGVPTVTSTTFVAPTAQASTALTWGSIVYSGDYGVTWAVQTPPAIYNARYSLFSVTVVKGTVAFAVGGNEYATAPAAMSPPPDTSSNGIIIATNNGGYSWYQQPLSMSAVPYFASATATSVSYGAFGNQSMPLLLGVANSMTPVSRAGGAPVAGAIPNITVWVVGCNGIMLTANLGPRNSMSVNSMVYGAQAGFQAVYNPAYPMGAHLTGIVWDNNLVGYTYGVGIIASTHDGGMTWALESPNLLVEAASASAGSNQASNYFITGLATVPTTY